jgi:hypothetical protein
MRRRIESRGEVIGLGHEVARASGRHRGKCITDNISCYTLRPPGVQTATGPIGAIVDWTAISNG